MSARGVLPRRLVDGDVSTLADGLSLVALSPHGEMGRGPGRGGPGVAKGRRPTMMRASMGYGEGNRASLAQPIQTIRSAGCPERGRQRLRAPREVDSGAVEHQHGARWVHCPVAASPLRATGGAAFRQPRGGQRERRATAEALGPRPRGNKSWNWPEYAARPVAGRTCPLQPRCPTRAQGSGRASTGQIRAPYAQRLPPTRWAVRGRCWRLGSHQFT
jgi:hypothetical protein